MDHDRYEAMPGGAPPRQPTPAPPFSSRMRPANLMGTFRKKCAATTDGFDSETSITLSSVVGRGGPNAGIDNNASTRSLTVSSTWVPPPSPTSATKRQVFASFGPTLIGQGGSAASPTSDDDDDPHQRIHQATTVSAFVTFLKALFGVSLLFQPRILGETGLILGSVIHVIIMSCCAFACYLLLMARHMAITDKERRDRESESLPGTPARTDASGGEAALPPPAKGKSKGHVFGVRDRLITYGDLVRQLMGRKLATVITSTIFVLHILFAAGMVAGATRNLIVLLNWQSDDNEEGENGGAGGEESDDSILGGTGQLALTALIFPLVLKLLLIRDLSGMFLVSAIGLIVYFVGCVGSMVYSAATFSEWEGGPDAPQDMWEYKWEGVPAFVASTVYAIEGINLALPTANNIIDQRKTVPVVSGAVMLYGLLTLAVAWVGYIGGLGGGPGTRHGEGGCHYISYCLSSPFLSKVHEFSLSVALIVTLPVILYPSTELLEVWYEERKQQAVSGQTRSWWGGFPAHLGNYAKRSKLFLRDKVDACGAGVVCEDSESYLNGCICGPCGDLTQVDDNWSEDIFGYNFNGQSDGQDNSMMVTTDDNSAAESTKAQTEDQEQSDEHPADIMSRHFRLRLVLALVVCVIGALEGRLYGFISFLRSVGLSFAGFCLPPALYFCAARQEGRINPVMLLFLGGLIIFGVFTMCLAFIPSFTDQEYMHTEEPR